MSGRKYVCESCAGEVGRAVGQVDGKAHDEALEALSAEEQLVETLELQVAQLNAALASEFATLAKAWQPAAKSATTKASQKKEAPVGDES